jgi:putative hemolysin
VDNDGLVKLILLLVALSLSAFFSASEAAFLSLQRSKLASLVKARKKGADKVASIAGRPDKLLPTVLTGNNLVNVAAASLATAIATSYLDANKAVVVSTIIVTIILLLFSEMLPKTIAAKNAERTAIFAVRPLQVAEILFFPMVWILERLSRATARLFGISGPTMITEEEIRSLIDVAQTEGVVEKSEAEMLEKVFHFGDRRILEVMTPRTEIVSVEVGSTLRELLEAYSRATHTRFPVFERDPENIVGILSVKDLLEAMAQEKLKPEADVTSLIRPVYFVPETKLVAELFGELRERRQQIAIAVDQYGGVAGLVTLNRLLEVIVGPGPEEGAFTENNFISLGEGRYSVDAGISMHDARAKLGIDLPDGEYQTLAGFILQQIGRIPHEGEHFHYEDLRVEIKEMRRVKIKRVEICTIQRDTETTAN